MDGMERHVWMGLLACSAPARLAGVMGDLPDHTLIRAPGFGTVMVRGRAGGTGSPFNMGEVTVTRCTLRLANGTVGHSCVQGRNADHARHAALADALMQTAPELTARQILAPLLADRQARDALRRERAAATKVEFFTLVRGED